MGVGQRIKERLESIGMAQAELARRVGLSQPAINGLIRGAARSTPKLHLIAAALGTTSAYLTGAIDDPDENAPPPPPMPTVQMVMMPVALPSEAALARMFEGLLEALPGLEGSELARELATLLPTALGSVRGPMIEVPSETAGKQLAPPDTVGVAPPLRRRA